MNDKNLLEAWYSQAFEISSPFNIMPLIDRAKVDFIYQTLVRFFGLKFFNANPHHDQAIDKISWLFSLLSNNKHLSCYHALYDICRLIEYAETLDESIQNDLSNLKKNPENLRSFFFELLYTDYLIITTSQIQKNLLVIDRF